MTKDDTRMFFNVSITNEEFEEHIKKAMNQYAEQVIYKNLDDCIDRIISRKANDLVRSRAYVKGLTVENIVRKNVENIVEKYINEHLNQIVATKLAAMLNLGSNSTP